MAESTVIPGAGAIGGTIGAHLARAGHDVVFVDAVPERVRDVLAGRRTISLMRPTKPPYRGSHPFARRASSGPCMMICS